MYFKALCYKNVSACSERVKLILYQKSFEEKMKLRFSFFKFETKERLKFWQAKNLP